jgi:glycosyltransferase involved in cell wall biosynthesis
VDLSLSVVLPVHNAEATLTRHVSELLELLPDIASRFDILIVDDGSTDQTEEIAHELTRYYPQIRLVRHQRRRGAEAAVETGLRRTSGDVVFVQDEQSEISASEIRQLWEMRHDHQLVTARVELPRRPRSPHLLDRVTGWGDQPDEAPEATCRGGIQMIRREAVEELEQLQSTRDDVHGCRSPRANFRAAAAHLSLL